MMMTYRASVIPRLAFESKSKRAPLAYPSRIFSVLNSNTNYPNKKYMIDDDIFKKKNAPILTFYAQLDDRGESPRDELKFRNCNIMFFVEDETVKVYEPSQRNAGFLQGILISRNKIPKPEGGHYKLEDFNIGRSVLLYGKCFKIYDCDPFTKNYLKEMGFRIGTPEPAVIDPVYADRQEMDKHLTAIKRFRHKSKISRFYKTHPKLLRFYGIYNYRPHNFEEVRYVSMYYDITDDTIKIVDEKKLIEYQCQLAIGNYDCHLILKPTLVPKNKMRVNFLGDSSPVILNLNAAAKFSQVKDLMSCRSGGANNPTGFLRDSNPKLPDTESQEYYTAEDFELGITLDIFGYKLFLYDCDEFTKEFYRNEFNKELIPVSLPEICDTKFHKLVYKEEFVDKEDSLLNCKKISSINMPRILFEKRLLIDKPNRPGILLKFFMNCRTGCDSKILTFLSRIITKDVVLKNQYFTVLFYLEDDTVEIKGLDLNLALTDSTTGAYMKRRKLTKPYSELENTGTRFYGTQDMFLGNVIYAMNKAFLLTDADEYTLDYMERRCDIFIHSNLKLIISNLFPSLRSKTSDIISLFEKHDFDKTGFLPYESFKSVLLDVIPEDLKKEFSEQQLKTVARSFASERYVGLAIEQLISKIQYELKKQKFQDFERLETLFRVLDMDASNNKGHFKPSRIYEVLRSYPLIVDRDVLKSFAYKFPRCEDGLISYKDVVKSLNYFENPVEPPENIPFAININWERVETVKDLSKISYKNFLKELTKEDCPNCK